MKVAFRADASLLIGTGHVMRCMTLANALAQHGAECHFLCREHAGNLIDMIRSNGHIVHALPCLSEAPLDCGGAVYATWLGATQMQDVQACSAILQKLAPDWLIVDHYALDTSWEKALQSFCRCLMVIDDLADRQHSCDLLLDQNLGRQAADYMGLVPSGCMVLVGPHYALLRPEFAALRGGSLRRREVPRLRKVLISMGGVDGPDATSSVLRALKKCPLSNDCQLDVVMGPKAPWLQRVRDIADEMPWPTEVLVNVAHMGRLMVDSDLSIGAAGSTSWERCCLGLPSIILVLAENQRFISYELDKAGAAKAIGSDEMELEVQLSQLIESYGTPEQLKMASKRAALVCDGLGVERIGKVLLEK